MGNVDARISCGPYSQSLCEDRGCCYDAKVPDDFPTCYHKVECKLPSWYLFYKCDYLMLPKIVTT